MPLWNAVRSANALLAGKPALRVDVRKEERQTLVELEVVGGDGDDRRGQGLGEVARRQGRPQALLGFRRGRKSHAQRLRVGGGRPALGEVERLDQQRVGHRLVEKGVVGARFGEQLGERGRAEAGAALVLDFVIGNSPCAAT